MLAAGSRIASGQWPYGDFWMNYPPGSRSCSRGCRGCSAPPAGLARAVHRHRCGRRVLAYALARRCAPERYALARVAGGRRRDGVPGPPGPEPDRARARVRRAAGSAGNGRRGRRAGGTRRRVPARDRGRGRDRGVRNRGAARNPHASDGGCGAFALVPLAPFFIAAPDAMLHDTIGFYASRACSGSRSRGVPRPACVPAS